MSTTVSFDQLINRSRTINAPINILRAVVIVVDVVVVVSFSFLFSSYLLDH
jgi:hypothetical protein